MTRASLSYDFLPFNPYTLQPTPAKDYLDSIGRSKQEFFRIMQRITPAFAKDQIESARVELKVTLGLLEICKKYFPDTATRTHDITIADTAGERLRGEAPVGFAEGYAQNAANLEEAINDMQARFDVAGLAQKTAALEFKLDFDSNKITLFDFETGSPKREQHNWEFTNRIFSLKHELHRAAWETKTKELRTDLFALIKNIYEPIEKDFKMYVQNGSLLVFKPDYTACERYVVRLAAAAKSSFFKTRHIKEIRRQLEAAKLEQQVLTQVVGVCSEFNLEEEGQELVQRLGDLNRTSIAVESVLANAGLLDVVGQAKLEAQYLGPADREELPGFVENNKSFLYALMVAQAENIYERPELPARLDRIIKDYYSGTIAGFGKYFKKWSEVFAGGARATKQVRAWRASGTYDAVRMLRKEWEGTKERLRTDSVLSAAAVKELEKIK